MMSPLPYIVVYTVRGNEVYVVRILHGAQQLDAIRTVTQTVT